MVTRFVLIVVVCVHLCATPSQIFAAEDIKLGNEQNSGAGPVLNAPLLEKALDGVSKIGDIARQVVKPAIGSDRAAANHPYVWVRMSKGYLASYVEREVDRVKPARDEILGITFTGTSRTTGTTRLVLRPSEDQATGHVVFEGEVQSRSTGQKGPATLHYVSNSRFRATKPLAITETGLTTWPAQAQAPTRLTPIEITTSLPGLRDRIARRIAWRRAAESQIEANAIASDHRARDIRVGLDQRLGEVVASIQSQIQSGVSDFALADGGSQLRIRSRSTPESVEVVLLPGRLEPNQFKMPAFQVAKNVEVAIRVHRSAIARAIMNPQLRDKLAAVTAALGQSQLNLGAANNASGGDQSKLAIDSEWIAFDLSGPAGETQTLRVAEAR